MKVNEARRYLGKVLDQDAPTSIMLWGSPGIGKSDIVRQVAAEKEWRLEDVRLLLLNPVDLRGIPVADRERGKAVWLKPEFLPDEGRGILFLDEINAVVPSVQAAAYQLVLDRRIGTYKLPDGWKVIAAGNRLNDRGVAYTMPSPLANRFLHLELESELGDWKKWALQQQPGKGGQMVSNIIPVIVSFLTFDPDYLFKFPNVGEEIRAFPSPRSWEFVSKMLRNTRFDTDDELRVAITSAVGAPAASAFLEYAKVWKKLPDIKECLEGKATFDKVADERTDIITASIEALVQELSKKPSGDRIDNFVKAILPLPREYQVMAVKDAHSVVGSKLEGSSAFVDWAKDNQEVLDG